ncbi:MAG: carbamoyl phosphate synthase small subunit [Lactobacillus sp.]|uniref:Carbamoyl phosphate synthase small chain n=1 Tax=Bombilactobacillus bombi TaxID=1303590 RepID=A0A417ZF58_9LACO|nr:carbamoyl phosphate synthase small subunit [Bombilactobacillus bombi]MCO6542898.1 carbamoyl phosphate synthase small subunit [Lactobacillus sp.]RHW49863.1 carbamoyl phosphate synthase small subunit [Bombilactobacillus bombi]
MKKYLILEDGTVFRGDSVGATSISTGELVVTNNIGGLEQTITDQTYNDQIIVFIAPLINTIGMNRDDYESIALSCKGVIFNSIPVNQMNASNPSSLAHFLEKRHLPGITNINVQRLAAHIKKHGSMKASIMDTDDEHAIDQIRALVIPRDRVKTVSTKQPYPNPNVGFKIAVIDLGLKFSILRQLSIRKCDSVILPYNTSAEDIMELDPDAVLFTSGPGDPHEIPETITTCQQLEGKIPIMGIGLGHLVVALANGAEIERMRYGHHGSNVPTLEIATENIEFSNHNHNYAVAHSNMARTNFFITYRCVNDNVIEGLRHRSDPTMTVQFQPEAAPGTHDALYVFDEFIEMINSFKQGKQL